MILYNERRYRHHVSTGHLVSFNIKIKETDLLVRAESDLKDAVSEYVFKYRGYIETYLAHNAHFRSSLVPLPDDSFAPSIIRDMLSASRVTGVGPMASVAGALSQWVGNDLFKKSHTVIIENGGDIFMRAGKDAIFHVAVFAGESPFSENIFLKIRGEDTPMGVCTSSGTVGGSLSFGKADAVSVLSKSATLADAAATALGNLIQTPSDIQKAIDVGKNIQGIEGIVIIVKDRMGMWGNVELDEA